MSSSYDGDKTVGDESVVSVTGGSGGIDGDVSVDMSTFSHMGLTSGVGDTSRINGSSGKASNPSNKQRKDEFGGGGGSAAQQEQEDLWGSILNSVKSSRVVPVKTVVLLGESRTGKSNLLTQLSAKSPSGFISHHHTTLEGASSALAPDQDGASPNPAGNTTVEMTAQQQLGAAADLGLGYGYFDIGDDDGEDVIARVGVYQLTSSHLSLLPFALPAPAEVEVAARGHSSASRLNGSSSLAAEASSSNSNGVRPNNTIDSSSSADLRPRPSIDALRDSLFLITLDWESPWTFLRQLAEWLDVVRQTVEEAAGKGKGKSTQWSREGVVLDEMKEKLQAYIRSYAEPSAPVGSTKGTGEADNQDVGNTSAIVAVSNPTLDGEDDLPLPEGCLTHNFGVPLVVVCTKADTIPRLERDHDFKEEQFDYIQQVLRTVCLKYGAALFFTAQSRAPSFDVLRSYLLHRLFTPVTSHGSSGGVGAAANGFAGGTAGGAAPSSTAFPFLHRASTVERDVLLVPSGWDSWGKIRALREGFDCAGTASGWEWDIEVERVRREKGLPSGSVEAEEAAEQTVERRGRGEEGVASAVRLYEDIIEDWEGHAPLNPANSRTAEPDDQAFLLQHYNALQKDPDPRSRFARATPYAPASSSASRDATATSSPREETESTSEAGQRSVVGPMGSSSLSLPSVERAMQERQEDGTLGSSSREGALGGASGTRSSKSGRSGGARSGSERERDRDGRSTPTLSLGSGTNSAGGSSRPRQSNAGLGLMSPTLAPGSIDSMHRTGTSGSGSGSGHSRPTSPAAGVRAQSPTMGPSTPGGGGGAGGQTPKQSEVLHSFFQSLLKEKSTSSPTPTSRSSRGPPGATGLGTGERR